jgi:uncharacterized membrane protein YgcG
MSEAQVFSESFAGRAHATLAASAGPKRRVVPGWARPAGLLLVAWLVAAAPASAATATVSLGTAKSFAVLAGSTVTNTGASVVNGDLGVSPGSAVTGFPPGQVSNGTIHAGDAVAAQAQNDLTTAYNDAAGRSSTGAAPADLAGSTLTSGVYTSSSSMALTGDLTLDGQGNADAVFIFQAGTTLTVGSGSRVLLVNGAQACNVFWQVGSSATIGTNSAFVGNILALTSITLATGANLQGRALAGNGAVTLDTNHVTKATCASQPSPPPAAHPSATNTSATTCAGQPVTVVLHGSDPEGAPLTYAIASGPSHGALGPIYQAGGTVTYTPNGGYTGPDSFTYRVSSRNGTSNTATATLTINPCDTGAGGSGGSGSGGGAGGGSGSGEGAGGGTGAGGGAGGSPAPGAGGPTAAPGDSGATDTPVQVVPAHSVGHAHFRVAYGRVVWAHGRRYFVIRVRSRRAHHARVRIRLSYRHGRVRYATRTVQTNRRLKLRGLRLAGVRKIRVTILG